MYVFQLSLKPHILSTVTQQKYIRPWRCFSGFCLVTYFKAAKVGVIYITNQTHCFSQHCYCSFCQFRQVYSDFCVFEFLFHSATWSVQRYGLVATHHIHYASNCTERLHCKAQKEHKLEIISVLLIRSSVPAELWSSSVVVLHLRRKQLGSLSNSSNIGVHIMYHRKFHSFPPLSDLEFRQNISSTFATQNTNPSSTLLENDIKLFCVLLLGPNLSQAATWWSSFCHSALSQKTFPSSK